LQQQFGIMLQLLLYRWLYIDPVSSTSSSSRSQPKRSRSGNNNAGGRVNRLRYQARSCLDFGIKSTLPPSMGPALACLLLDFPVSVPRLHPTATFGFTAACVVIDAIVHSTGVCLSALVHPNSNSRSKSSSAARTRRMQRLEAEVGILVKSIIGWLTGSAIRLCFNSTFSTMWRESLPPLLSGVTRLEKLQASPIQSWSWTFKINHGSSSSNNPKIATRFRTPRF
jgi:hypothetical protein